MIKSLYIKDFALIDELEISFEKGLNILTGQTGAGKSIIVGALNMILGERADTDTIRQGSKKAIAEAIIEISDDTRIHTILEEHEIEHRKNMILRREIRDTGSRAFINDSPVPIGVLRKVGDLLVDLHGQHDHQLLLKDEHHRELIDHLPSVIPIFSRYSQAFSEASSKKKELEKLRRQDRDLTEKLDLYRFQYKELNEANLDPDEIEEMQREMNLLDNAEDLDLKASLITSLGSDAEANVMEMLTTIREALDDMARMEPEFETYREELKTASISIQEMLHFTERYRNNIEHNPARLEELRQRQSELNRIQKKYLRDIPGLIEMKEDLAQKISLADNYDLAIERAEKSFQEACEVLTEAAITLHESRKKAGKELSTDITEELKKLGIPHSAFELRSSWIPSANGWISIDGQPVECTAEGCEQLIFYISTNKGEAPRPLAKTASGGEISRVMLALKSVLAREQYLPVMIFDEIDTGISGAVAEQVGKTMRELASTCQIIAITHQPQIASQAHFHYEVEKWEEGERTVTHMKRLSNSEHEKAVASLISGAEITDAATQSAREMIAKAVS